MKKENLNLEKLFELQIILKQIGDDTIDGCSSENNELSEVCIKVNKLAKKAYDLINKN